jgi:hypothetical protein
MVRRLIAALAAAPLLGAAAMAQPPVRAPAAAAAQPTYADLADLALQAPVAAQVRLRRAIPLRGAEAVGVAPGFARFLMETDVVALIRGEAGMPTQLRYLADLPNSADGKPARPAKRSEWLIFARTLPGRPGELQLVSADAQLPATPDLAQRVRTVLREFLAPDAPPALTGIGRSFHVPGVLPGASETQIFLQTARNLPISLTIRREPQEQPRWFVSLSEFVDASATQPAPNTLLWYRLACFLPAQLPQASLAEAPEHAQAIQADYRLVRQGLGPCSRTRARR